MPDDRPVCACGDFLRGTETVCAACRGTDRYINQTEPKETDREHR